MKCVKRVSLASVFVYCGAVVCEGGGVEVVLLVLWCCGAAVLCQGVAVEVLLVL